MAISYCFLPQEVIGLHVATLKNPPPLGEKVQLFDAVAAPVHKIEFSICLADDELFNWGINEVQWYVACIIKGFMK